MKDIIDIEQVLRLTENKHPRHRQKSLALDSAQIYWKKSWKAWTNYHWHWTNAQSKNSNIIDLDMSSEIYFIHRSRQHRHHPSSTTAIIRIGRRGGFKRGGLLILNRCGDSTTIKSRWTNKGWQICCACIKYETKELGIDLFPKNLGLQDEQNRGRGDGENQIHLPMQELRSIVPAEQPQREGIRPAWINDKHKKKGKKMNRGDEHLLLELSEWWATEKGDGGDGDIYAVNGAKRSGNPREMASRSERMVRMEWGQPHNKP